ncbi:MAG: class I SAM-dependent methyltransferase, partial [Pseudomonadota bacterium]
MTFDQAFWDKLAPKYYKQPISDMQAYEETLARTVSYLGPETRMLELGCGTGRNLAQVGRRWPRAALFGLDISQEMLVAARAKL